MTNHHPVVAILGAGGFIGSAVARAATQTPGWTVHALTRQPGPTQTDVRDAAAVERALASASIVVHAATYIGNDPALCNDVNVKGTRNVVAAAARRGARIVYVSTAAVYGHEPYRRLTEHDGRPCPQSPLSTSRAAAEEVVLDAGGIVVRPHLVVGEGDRWVGPGIAALTKAVGGLIDGGTASHSIIEVDMLGELITRLAFDGTLRQSIYHAAHLEPLPAERIGKLLWPTLEPGPSVDLSTAQRIVADTPLAAALRLLGSEHTLDTQAATALLPELGDAPLITAAGLSWYRRFQPAPTRTAGTPSKDSTATSKAKAASTSQPPQAGDSADSPSNASSSPSASPPPT